MAEAWNLTVEKMEHQKWKLPVALKIRKAYRRINGLVGAYNYYCHVDLIKKFEWVRLLSSLVFMDNEMSYVHGGGIPPPSGWSTGFTQTNDPSDDIPEQQSSSTLPLLVPAPNFVPEPCILGQGGGETDSSQFGPDISHDLFRNLGLRGAHSKILTCPDNGINFDGDSGILGGGCEPFFSDEDKEPDLYGIYVDMDRLNSSSAAPPLFQVGEPSSVAVAVLPSPLPPPSAVAAPLVAATGPALGHGSGYAESSAGERPRMRHQHSQSVDGSTIINPQMLASSPEGPSRVERKKALSAAQLTELALVDSRRAKRILLNRQSATRSKERKLRCTAELERKVQTLQTQATALTSQLALLQKETTGLNTENHELKYRLQTMEQRVQLQDALNNVLEDEIKHMKVLTGQVMPNGAPAMVPLAPFAPRPMFYPRNNSDLRPLIAAQQLQQLQIQPPEPQHPFQVQHQQLPLQLQLPQLQQPTGDFSCRGPVHLAIQGDNHAADNSSTMRN
ncbi:probable transcription factor PosF21 [Rhodamnia argentea]|uniref:Probable transcription factor PosF21 n=1 Tax=Rhodamnia argentea TaxID=178133 RepID=A0A8B8PQF7_9MYRT|nr:probable transcription factor PosF21 [Rhodamnia argentea]